MQVVVPGPAGNKMQRDFAFHACLGPDVVQADVIHLCGIPQLLDAALAGYNVTIFAYGQTGGRWVRKCISSALQKVGRSLGDVRIFAYWQTDGWVRKCSA